MYGMILGPDGIVVVVVVAIVVLFGGSKLPQLARGIGNASREFKKRSGEGGHFAGFGKRNDSDANTPLRPIGANQGPEPAMLLCGSPLLPSWLKIKSFTSSRTTQLPSEPKAISTPT